MDLFITRFVIMNVNQKDRLDIPAHRREGTSNTTGDRRYIE